MCSTCLHAPHPMWQAAWASAESAPTCRLEAAHKEQRHSARKAFETHQPSHILGCWHAAWEGRTRARGCSWTEFAHWQAAWASAEADSRAELEAAREEQRHSASETLNVLKLSLEAQARL